MVGTAPAYRRNPEAKQELLLDAAATLFADQGFDNTTTQQIAAAAGVSEGILFHHFGSKKGLFSELAHRFAEAAVRATMPADHKHLTEAFVVNSAFDFAEQNAPLYSLFSSNTADISGENFHTHSEVLINAISQNLTIAMQHGEIRKGNPHIMAQLQFAIVDAAYRAWRDSGKTELRQAYIDEAIASMRAMGKPIEVKSS